MTNAELLYLLAAARGSVFQHKERLLDCDHDAESCTCDLAAQKIALLARIDAALAAHDAVPPSEEKVEWELTYDSQTYSARIPCGTHDWQVTAACLSDGRCVWYALAGYAKGYCDTLDEAKSAAIAAARGVR